MNACSSAFLILAVTDNLEANACATGRHLPRIALHARALMPRRRDMTDARHHARALAARPRRLLMHNSNLSLDDRHGTPMLSA
jgi:hypothetical protein